MRNVFYILVALTFAAVESPAQQQNSNEILTKVASTYATCSSYYDEGSISTGSEGLRYGSFRTTFVRPGHLGFEFWLGEGEKFRAIAWIVLKNGDSVHSWLPSIIQPGFNKTEVPLDTALSRMATPSSGASLTIPTLLLPDLFRIADIIASTTSAKVTGEEKIDGRQTLKIEGTLWGNQPVKFWIDKTDYVIVKVARKVELGNRKVESTVRFKPKLNAKIPAEQLVFKAPANQTTDSVTRTPTSTAGAPPALAARLRKFGSSLTFDAKVNASTERETTDDEVIRVDTDLVVSALLVMDKEGKLVTGLTKDDFIVKEDGIPQEVATLSLGDSKDIPRSIVLIIDYSASQLPYISTSIEAAKKLVDKLNPKDRMAVVTDDVRLLVDFTSDKESLKAQLESLKVNALSGAPGASEQYDALMATMTELFSPEDARPIIIFQTDGDQLEALKGGTPQPYNAFSLPRKFGLEDILKATERSRVAVYSVISGVRFFGVPQTELLKRAEADWSNRSNAQLQLLRPAANNSSFSAGPTTLPDEILQQQANTWVRRHTALAAVAKFTGAWTEFLEQPSQADEIYNRILTDIDRRYVIGYYPTNRARDGKRRKVHIEIRDHPEYVVWGQKTYFAREER